MIGAAVEAMGLQGIDCRLHGGMRTPRRRNFGSASRAASAALHLPFYGNTGKGTTSARRRALIAARSRASI
jgi:hypothetical protein